MKTPLPSSRARPGVISGVALTLLAGCLQPIPQPADQSSFPAIERRNSQLLGQLTDQEHDALNPLQQHVTINAEDILLPEAAPEYIETERSYYFDVVVNDPAGRTMQELLEKKLFRIETIGVDATLVYPQPDPRTRDTPIARLEPSINLAKARLKVTTSKDGSLRPFTIRAWYPNKIAGPDPDRWMAVRQVKVFYGDIRTRVQIVSRTEARSLFGSTFAEHFYVGRVFLRNRSTTKSLAVFTTSMRVPVLFYRRTELPGGLTPAAAERLAHLATLRWPVYKNTGDLLGGADQVVLEFLQTDRHPGARRDPFLRAEGEPTDRYRRGAPAISRDERDALVARVLAEWSRLKDQDNATLANEHRLTPKEKFDLVGAAMIGAIPNTTDSQDEEAPKIVSTKLTRALPSLPAQAQDLVKYVWTLRQEARAQAVEDKNTAEAAITRLQEEIPGTTPESDTKQAQRYQRIARTLNGIADRISQPAIRDYTAKTAPAAAEPTDALLKDISGVIDDSDRETFRRIAFALPHEVNRYATAAALEKYLDDIATGRTDPAAPIPLAAVENIIADLRERATWLANGPASAQRRPKREVNLGHHALAVSPDPHLQRQLLESGYVWRDSYRPMTFQAVLNSVMFTHEQNPRTATVRVLEALATIAGGAVGLSGEPDSGFLRGTNFFSSVFVPTLRKTIVEDLNKHITNLGQMAMDNVVIIEPNSSVDGYVFFPRGPIYNFPDEFDSITPAYIRGIEGEELFVEAVPIASDQVVRGGSVDANTLVTRALNEGERSESARLLDAAATQAKLRTTELGNLVTRIRAVITAADKAADEEIKKLPEAEQESKAQAIRDTHLKRAHDQVRQMAAAFITYFGPDQSGTLAATLTQHAITLTDAPPVAQPANSPRLPVGTTSVPWPLNVTDPDTALTSLKFEQKKDPDADQWFNATQFKPDDAQRPRAIISVTKTDLAEPERKELPLTVSDGTNIVEFSQPIQLMPLRINPPVFQSNSSTPKQLSTTDGAARVELGRDRGSVIVSVPLYDADKSLLKLVTPRPADGSGSVVESSRAGIDDSNAAITLRIQLDTSAVAAGASNPEFTVYLVPADAQPDEASLKNAALAQLRLVVVLDLPTNPPSS